MGLGSADAGMDAALAALYDHDSSDGGERGAGLGASAPRVARWLGDIRGYFPSTVVQVMQKDAIERLGLDRMLLEPEMLEAVVRRVVGDLERKLSQRIERRDLTIWVERHAG